MVDDDGAVVIPKDLVEFVAHEGAEHELYESWVFTEVEKGVQLPGLYPPNEEAKARYPGVARADSIERGAVFFVLSKLLAFFARPVEPHRAVGHRRPRADAHALRPRGAGGLRRPRWSCSRLIGFLPLGRALIDPLENRFPRWDPAGRRPPGSSCSAAPSARISWRHAARSASTMRRSGSSSSPSSREPISAGADHLQRRRSRPVHHDGSEARCGRRHCSKVSACRASRITLENRSRNTAENAVFSKALAEPKPGERWLLVTSAIPHAARDRCVPPGRVSGRGLSGGLPDQRLARHAATSFGEPLGGLRRTDVALHEWIGLIAYRLTGKSFGRCFRGLSDSAVRARCAAEANWRRHITMTIAVVDTNSGHGPANQPR